MGWVEVVRVSLLVMMRRFESRVAVFGRSRRWWRSFDVVAGEVYGRGLVLVAVERRLAGVKGEGAAGVVEVGVGVLVQIAFCDQGRAVGGDGGCEAVGVGLVGGLFLRGGDDAFAPFDGGFLHGDRPRDAVQFVVETCFQRYC